MIVRYKIKIGIYWFSGTLTPFSRSGEESPLSSRFENSSSLAASVCNSSYSDLLDDFCTGIYKSQLIIFMV